MKARQRISDFLISLASMINNASIDEPPATVVGSQHPAAAAPEAKPRAPALPPQSVAAYWQRSLDFINFKSYSTDKSKDSNAAEPLLVLPIAEVPDLGTQVDENDQSRTTVDVNVVVVVWEMNARGQRALRRHPLLSVPAVLVDGQFFAPRSNAAPMLNPDYLAPDQAARGFAIAERDVANARIYKAMADLAADDTLNLDWATWWSACQDVMRELLEVDEDAGVERELVKLARESRAANSRNGKPAEWSLQVAVFASQGGGSQGMRGVYSTYLDAAEAPVVPLFDSFCGTEVARQTHEMPGTIANLIVGHIDEYDESKGNRPLFPLDESQRKAVCAVASLQEGELQAINGPPGSGKTSMLRAVVASRWVSAALQKGECPIIVACGATNQSVTNVIEAFGKAPHPDARLAHAQRWLPDLQSYGAYLPSQSVLNDKKKQAELARFVCLIPGHGTGMLWQYRNRPNVLDPRKALEFEEQYLQRAREVLGNDRLSRLEDAVAAVWERLAGNEQAGQAFLDAVSARSARWLPLIEAAKPADPTVWPAKRHEVVSGLIGQLHADLDDVEAAQGLMDLTFRSDAFHWAARYWEGRFLLAQRERLLSQHPLNVEAALRRLCMLTPCLVSTLHSVASLCKVQPPSDGDPNVMHRLSLIDLLVIDEAGQASPELAGAALLLAKCAAVVGDLKQLSPIWNHNNLSEIAVAASVEASGLISGLKQSRRSVADGSILAAARLVSKWREANDLGITLRYHYRCKPSIIGYCNELSYAKTLVPRTTEGVALLEPAMAWVAIESLPGRSGGSLSNPQEVEHITSWIGERWPIWQADAETRGKRLQDIVALITAYRAQADLLRKGLEKVFERLRATAGIQWPTVDDIEKVTVGTVHQLQGAERPIVCFSVVEGPEDASGSFMDRDAALLNVAVSRAKSSFIVFAHPQRLFAEGGSQESNTPLAPIHFLGAYLRRTTQARLLYPRRMVIIEAGGKQRTLANMLGKTCAVLTTGGALQGLSLDGGVDIGAGLVPLPHPEERAPAFLAEAFKLLAAVEDVIIATDDDRMGELIAWQVQRLLRDGIGDKPVARVRLGAINGPAVRGAFAAPGQLDEGKVLAEAVRETIDCLVTQRFAQATVLKASVDMGEFQALVDCGACLIPGQSTSRVRRVGRVQAAVLRLLLDRARESAQLQASSRIRATLVVEGVELHGYVLNFDEQRELTKTHDVARIIEKIKPYCLKVTQQPEVIRERISVPHAGTFSVLAEAWRRFRHLPWDSMTALQALYDGSWSSSTEAADGFEPEQPIVVSNEQAGHPPIMPLDRAASPQVLSAVLHDPVCRDIYTIIWERFLFAESAQDTAPIMTDIRVDYRFDGLERSALGVRFEGVGCTSLTQEQLVLLLEGGAPGNDAEHLLTYYPDLTGLQATLQAESAGLWRMSLDRLLLEMERAQIGRPSTCSASLQGLIEKKLIELPIDSGQVRLTEMGVKTALALEMMENALSAPGFSAGLAQRLVAIEKGDEGPQEVLGDLLGLLIPDCADEAALRSKIWNSLDALQSAQDRHPVQVRGSGIISAPTARGWA